jgi:hypothetical protein
MSLLSDHRKANRRQFSREGRARRWEKFLQKSTLAYKAIILELYQKPMRALSRQGGGRGGAKPVRNQSIPAGYNAGETARQRKDRLKQESK